ncbi:pre-rRNA processing protein ftsj3 [Cichlidogyrus casuarinus]|uniref:Pre-rRNA processing protein ftsj3 n=1 Tax=Cichlidogyrus casuarinus TaxID=1844966 RepID=A0ABD2Q6B0_9PLAT
MPVSSKIIGVDLVPIQPIPRVKTFAADITTDKCRMLIKNELNGVKADVILNDGAPNVGAAWSIDEYNQAQLCLKAFSLATDFLRKGGWFVTKVFRSKDYEPLKWVLSQFFKTVKSVKPEASRLESAEIFIVAQSYLAPDKIDPKFLDPKHVFSEVEQPLDRNEVVAKRATGYDEGDILYTEMPVMQFIESEDPLVSLAKINKIIIDVPEIEAHPTTTSAIKALLDDIRVLGKADINQDKVKEPTEDDIEEELEAQIANAMEEERKTLKKQLKKARVTRRKLAERIVNKMHHQGDYIEQADTDLFSLKTIDNLAQLYESGRLIGDTSVTGADEHARETEAEAVQQAEDKQQEQETTAIEGLRTVKYAKRGSDKDDQHIAHLGLNETHVPDDILMDTDEEASDSESDSAISSEEDEELSEDAEEEEKEKEAALPQDLAEKRDRMIKLINRKYRREDEKEAEALEPPTKKAKQFSLFVDLDDQDELTKKKNSVKKWCESSEIKVSSDKCTHFGN